MELLADQLPHPSHYAPTIFLPPDSERGKVILIPVGHTEQHGCHLPLSVDTIIIEAIAQGIVSKMPTRSYSLPVMPYGVSTQRGEMKAMGCGERLINKASFNEKIDSHLAKIRSSADP